MNEENNYDKDTILVVDDNKNNLDLMLVTLSEENYRLLAATSGERALKIVTKVKPDLILMDIQMPGMNGYETTQKLKENEELKHVPVLFLSALNDLENIVKCFAAGGVDYISKPFKKEELLARVRTHLSIKKLQSRIIRERDKISTILNNVLPSSVVSQLKNGEKPQPELVDDVVVLFTDFSNFTQISKALGPTQSIENLNMIFSAFDQISAHFGLERIKTIGDAYMAVGGVTNLLKHSALHGVMAGLKMQEFLDAYNRHHNTKQWKIRVGVNSGPVMAGIVGIQKIAFDVWGDTVNLTSRLESTAKLSGVNITSEVYSTIENTIAAVSRGPQYLHNWGHKNLFHCTGLTKQARPNERELYESLSPQQLFEAYEPQQNLLDKIISMS